jgi:hypothetical protein
MSLKNIAEEPPRPSDGPLRAVFMTCPRMCGGRLVGTPVGVLVEWKCQNPTCDYVIHS